MASSLEELKSRHERVMSRHGTYMITSRILLFVIVFSSFLSVVLMLQAGCNNGISWLNVWIAIVLIVLSSLFLGLALKQQHRGSRAFARTQRLLGKVSKHLD